MRYYGRLPVNVERVWYGREGVERIQFVDVKVIGSGKSIDGIKSSELSDSPVEKGIVKKKPIKDNKKVIAKTNKSKMVAFTKKDKTETFAYGSDEYKKFVKDNKLNENMIDNCLKGVVKTHKGYTIKYI